VQHFAELMERCRSGWEDKRSVLRHGLACASLPTAGDPVV
jgi:hypothetical protein